MNENAQTPTDRLELNRHLLWIGALVTYGVGDLLTTAYGLSNGVPESNVLPSAVLDAAGFGGLVALKLAFVSLAFVAWTHGPDDARHGIPVGLALVGAAVTAWNLTVIA